jgi:hypothetical protein
VRHRHRKLDLGQQMAALVSPGGNPVLTELHANMTSLIT